VFAGETTAVATVSAALVAGDQIGVIAFHPLASSIAAGTGWLNVSRIGRA